MTQREQIALVMPGRNVAPILAESLQAVTQLQRSSEIDEIIFVDDASTDDTRSVAASFPVRVIEGSGAGSGAARNLGWRAASGKWIWFLDSDCVPQQQALAQLVSHLSDGVAGVGGSLANRHPDRLLACLIHEEILARHQRMAGEVDFLATGSVIYRRDVLKEVDGFDERFRLAQDAELAFRVRQRGYRLLFEPQSLVAHAYPKWLFTYLKRQSGQGYFRMLLYRRYPRRITGDSYSGFLDHVQPPLALVTLATLPLVVWPYGTAFRWCPMAFALLLFVATIPMATTLLRHTSQWKYLLYAPFSFVRAFARGLGMIAGAIAALCWRFPH